jgi:hypothetical protein
MKRTESEEANEIESMKIAELSRDLSPFIKFGTCHRPLNSAGWDILFDMKVDGVDEFGMWGKIISTGVTLVKKSSIYLLWQCRLIFWIPF